MKYKIDPNFIKVINAPYPDSNIQFFKLTNKQKSIFSLTHAQLPIDQIQQEKYTKIKYISWPVVSQISVGQSCDRW